MSYAQQAFGLAHSMYRAGTISADAACTWSLRIYEAQKDSPTGANAAKEHLDRMLALEKLAIERVQSGLRPGARQDDGGLLPRAGRAAGGEE